jgi:hypothetical protein
MLKFSTKVEGAPTIVVSKDDDDDDDDDDDNDDIPSLVAALDSDNPPDWKKVVFLRRTSASGVRSGSASP